ncbi:UNVERIFIED_CONTAM: hypothetical protein K2H54_039680 [Gekko kuhli]
MARNPKPSECMKPTYDTGPCGRSLYRDHAPPLLSSKPRQPMPEPQASSNWGAPRSARLAVRRPPKPKTWRSNDSEEERQLRQALRSKAALPC